jgi:hypothetical protein
MMPAISVGGPGSARTRQIREGDLMSLRLENGRQSVDSERRAFAERIDSDHAKLPLYDVHDRGRRGAEGWAGSGRAFHGGLFGENHFADDR